MISDDFKAVADRRKTVIVARCDSGNETSPVIALASVDVRDRFMWAAEV